MDKKQDWGFDDLARCRSLIEKWLALFNEAVEDASAETIPHIAVRAEHVPKFVLFENYKWPGTQIHNVVKDMRGRSAGANDVMSVDLIRIHQLTGPCNAQPKRLLAVIKNLQKATAVCQDIRKRRDGAAEKLLREQAEDIRELRTMFVAEELKKATE